MDVGDVTFGLAILAGIVSFLSPCVLSLVPAYIGYLGGRAVAANGGTQTIANRWVTFTHGVAFVFGFSFIFISFGVAAGLLGALFGVATFQFDNTVFSLRDLIARVGGIVIIVFGLHTLGVITLPFLETDTRQQVAPRPELGYLSSAMMGVFFSAGWSPCVGPVLGTLLTLAMNATTVNVVGNAAWLLTGYSLGLAIPFLVAALAIGEVSRFIRQYSRYTRYISIFTGIMLVIIGLLLLTGQYQLIAAELGKIGTFFDFGI